ncbi:MAG: hypothetical protein ACK5X3_06870 [Pseudomonadota bacterium]
MSRQVWTFAVLVSLTALLGIQSIRVDGLKDDLREARRELEVLREAREAAVADAQSQAGLCAARVAEARRSTRAIQSLLNKDVVHDEAGCPVAGLLDAGELRQALQPDAPAPEPVQ